MSRVLVTGASGFLAMHVVKQLLDSGEYIVRGTVRSLANEKKVKPLNELSPENAKYPLELVEADLTKKETWVEAVKDCTYVIHVASPFPAQNPKDEILHYPGRHLPCFSHELRTRFWFPPHFSQHECSRTAAIYSGRVSEDGHVFTEEDWSSLENSLPYEKSKHLAEKAA
ncbi:unnamed protein product [Porites evermanni]|uniref:NAD-dependent epimerase/dehydratase domain-containing protein n=1 Tax=Porites evermanni TaxID=104178 RepID=A0ABN8SJW5_9CNID|nr:unnamed protein product [Porites evermanni]